MLLKLCCCHLAYNDGVLLAIADSALLAKLLQSLSSNQVVIAISHDDMQTQSVDHAVNAVLVQFF